MESKQGWVQDNKEHRRRLIKLKEYIEPVCSCFFCGNCPSQTNELRDSDSVLSSLSCLLSSVPWEKFLRETILPYS